MSEPYGIIYLITNVVTNKHYVGQTTGSLHNRWMSHCRQSYCRRLSNAIKKYGREKFLVEKVFECDNHDDLNEMETRCIVALMSQHNGYNLSTGGSSRKPSEESRFKMSASHKGSLHTDETLAVLSEKAKTRWQNQEFKEKALVTIKSKTHSAESRAKRSITSMGHPVSEESRSKMSEAAKSRLASPEAKERHANINKGRKLSTERRVAISKQNKGKIVSPETRTRMSQARKAYYASRPAANS